MENKKVEYTESLAMFLNHQIYRYPEVDNATLSLYKQVLVQSLFATKKGEPIFIGDIISYGGGHLKIWEIEIGTNQVLCGDSSYSLSYPPRGKHKQFKWINRVLLHRSCSLVRHETLFGYGRNYFLKWFYLKDKQIGEIIRLPRNIFNEKKLIFSKEYLVALTVSYSRNLLFEGDKVWLINSDTTQRMEGTLNALGIIDDDGKLTKLSFYNYFRKIYEF